MRVTPRGKPDENAFQTEKWKVRTQWDWTVLEASVTLTK